MKNIFALGFLLCAFSFTTRSQISIATTDLPHANDTFRVSIGQITPGIDATLSGPGYTWDYSTLIPTAQRVDSFIDESATSTVFSIVFIDNAFNTNRANQATRAADFSLGTMISLSGVFNFYYNSNASYKQVGLGANVNGIPLPIAYSPHDIIYKLPLQYPSTDSSNSGYAVDLVSTIGIYYKVSKTRKNEVDGWGTLTTPFGTFDALRVHSTVVERDSLYLDTLGFGFNLPPFTTHEYKWLGVAAGIPLLQINTGSTGNINQIIYRDSLKSLVNVDQIIRDVQNLTIYPNPAANSATISYHLTRPSLVSMDIISVEGKIFNGFLAEEQSAGTHAFQMDLSEMNLSAGNYLVRLITNGQVSVLPLIVSDSK